jgi:two-component system NtrC family sensor kinase
VALLHLASAGFAGLSLTASLLGSFPWLDSGILVAYGIGSIVVGARLPRFRPLLLVAHVVAVVLLTLEGTLAPVPLVILLALVALAVGTTVVGQTRSLRALADSRERQAVQFSSERDRFASQLDRRINQIFSLQELSYVLSESLQEDRIVTHLASYVSRFLQTRGTAVLLVNEGGDIFRVAAGEGALQPFVGTDIAEASAPLISTAVGGERLEVAGPGPVTLFDGCQADAAAIAPLHAHGVTMGGILVTDPREAEFTTEDLWLLSTVATQTAVVLANSRFFEMFRRGKEEWETTFDALTEGIAIVDREGRLRRVNRALARLVGIPEPSLIGKRLAELVFGGEDQQPDAIALALAGERPPVEIVQSNALRRTLRVTASPLSATTQEVATIVVLLEDVTEQRDMEALLIQNEKMAAVGQLVSGVAHELNNPLTSISGLSEFLMEPGHMPESHTEHMRVIHEQAERAGRIVQSLLTFARKGEPETAEVDVNQVVRRTLRLVEHEFTLHGISLTSELATGPVVIRGDQHEMQQVMLNLLTNAIHALTELPEDATRAIRVRTAFDQDITVSISDTGPGVPEDAVGRLFTPFFTTKEPGRGTGLGLSISYGIVKSHGGTIVYDPPSSGGAGFLITLPSAGTGSPRESVERIVVPRRVLVVDQDRTAARVLTALFTPEGFQVDVVDSADSAWEHLVAAPYELVVTDVRATLGDGRKFRDVLEAQDLVSRSRVLLSASDIDRTGDEALDTGPFPVLRKPFKPQEVLAQARKALDRP